MGTWIRRLKRCALWLTILVAMLLIVNACVAWWAGNQLEQRLTKLRETGEPTCFADLAPDQIPPEENAAFQLQRLFPELGKFAKDHFYFLDKTSEGKAYLERREIGEAPTKEDITAIREVLQKYSALLGELRQTANCKGYASQADFSLAHVHDHFEPNMESAMNIRTAARFLHWQIMVQIADKDLDGAVETGIVLLRLARLFDGEPFLVNGLLGIALRQIYSEGINLALRAGPLSNKVHEYLDQELAQHDDPLWLVRVLKTERAFGISAWGDITQEFSRHPLAWWTSVYQANHIDFFDELLPLVALPWHESTKAINRLNQGTSSGLEAISGAAAMILPGVQSANDAFNRSTALLRCLRILNKLTAYSQANGHEAAGLDDLDLPEIAKLDPFSGEPLRLKWTDAGWVVYSVFKNGTDDKGNFKDQADWGLAPTGYPGAE